MIHKLQQGPPSPNQQIPQQACRQEGLGRAWCVGKAFNKCLLEPPESPGSSTTIPYFPQVEPEQGVTLRPGGTKTPDHGVQSGMCSWNTLVFNERPDCPPERPLIQREQEPDSSRAAQPRACGIRPEATRSDHIFTSNLGKKPTPCVRNHLL